MDSTFKPFDFHRIFVGDAPWLFLLEIVFRTLIMYSYTVLLLRILGKRGMGQLSMLELAIIISFGSAVGDPMVGAYMPIVHGLVAITVITIFQIALERFINRSRKVEALMEGSPNLVVSNGVINWVCMKRDNISKEDLFRALRGKNVQHLGQVKKAFFETSGAVSVFLHSPKKVKPGLAVLPDEMVLDEEVFKEDEPVAGDGLYACMDCGHTLQLCQGSIPDKCTSCKGKRWVNAEE
jgi:uncharacterized membrane protein YcaP (DUF421 family)/DNA-directed RNA polymerase subunit RPC12/RpoP